MALFTITTKRKKICNGVQIEPGMTVQVVSPFNNPVTERKLRMLNREAESLGLSEERVQELESSIKYE